MNRTDDQMEESTLPESTLDPQLVASGDTKTTTEVTEQSEFQTVQVDLDIEATEPLHIRVKPSRKDDDIWKITRKLPAYSMASSPRAHALIVNITDFPQRKGKDRVRTGAEVDAMNILELFHQMDIKVEYHKDVYRQEFCEIVRSFADAPHASDCNIVVIMSHGNETGILCADEITVKYEWIIEKFDNYHCSWLRNKPKIFFFQSCRGITNDVGVPSHTTTASERKTRCDSNAMPEGDNEVCKEELTYHPTQTDIHITYSTIPNRTSIRHFEKGSWFIRTLCQVMMNNAFDTDLETMLKLVQNEVKNLSNEDGYKQTVETVNRCFTKDLFFFPGLQ